MQASRRLTWPSSRHAALDGTDLAAFAAHGMKVSLLRTSGQTVAKSATERTTASTRQVSGHVGALLIGGTLAAVRLWAWLPRTPFYKD